MSRFDFALKYIASKSMGQADNLSGLGRENKKGNENQMMLKKEVVGD